MLLFEIEITFGSDRHQMDMGVRHFKADDRHRDTFARDSFLDSLGDFLGKDHHGTEGVVIQVEQVIGFQFGNHEGVTFREGIDVEKSKETVVLSYFIARNLALYDSGKDSSHNVRLSSDFKDFKKDLTSRHHDLGHFAHFFPKQALTNR